MTRRTALLTIKMSLMKKLITLLASALLLSLALFAPLSVQALNYQLFKAGNWNKVSSWKTNGGYSGYPGTNIGTGHNITISANCTMNVNVTSASPITVVSSRSLTISSGKTFTYNSTTVFNASGIVTNYGEIIFAGGSDMTIANTGRFRQYGTQASFTGNLTNNGRLEVKVGETLEITSNGKLAHNGSQADISGTLKLSGSATMDVGTGKTLKILKTGPSTFGTLDHSSSGEIRIFGTLDNRGDLTVGTPSNSNSTLTIENTGTFSYTGQTANIYGNYVNKGTTTVYSDKTLTVVSTGVFDHQSGTATISGTLDNSGTVQVQGGQTLTINKGGTLINNNVLQGWGSIVKGTAGSGAATFTNNSSGTFTNDNTFTTSNFSFTNDGTINGTGTISSSSAYTNTGTIAPGNSAGTVTIAARFINNGVLDIELADAAWDQIIVTGGSNYATLNGTINISFIGGIEPTITTFTILTAPGDITGTPTINWPAGYTGSAAVVLGFPNEYQVSFSPLPIELTDFKAALNGPSVLLQWQTASEQNNDGFELQRSPSGKEWQPLAFVQGAGTTFTEQRYTYTDGQPFPGLNYYRLKQMDYDGKFEYSKVISMEMAAGQGRFQLFPNPATDRVTLSLPSNGFAETTLTILDLLGRQLLKQKILPGPGSGQVDISLSEIPTGIYLLRMEIGREVWQERLVVAHD